MEKINLKQLQFLLINKWKSLDEQNKFLILGILLCFIVLAFAGESNSSSKHMPEKPSATADTFIPAGYVLVPTF